ncbi:MULTISPECIES: TolC family protein [Alteromonas]|uniref:TolC family protein n=1 Tax=Alteromonas stellipolaris TaxID=233316 RepID=A0AAW7Z363_9ALTE|nr:MULTISPECIES: TolC family protein [Alteromonas]AMJ88907.1 transporter [Alteromonas sp. Mac1]AMJ92755.1 transporter [Alteromonas sp. Mac2]ANB23568.1 transporter [Alteromonas stellipolaris]MDO6579229.1 TolC family protein [Alteromonas stellipolaris]
MMIVLLTTHTVVIAQTNSTNNLEMTLQSAIQRTLTNSPELHEFTYRQQALEGEIKTASLKPEITAGIELENFLGTGDVSGTKDTEMTLTLSSVIELGNKLNSRKAFAKAQSTLVEAQKQVQTLDVLAEVTRRYIDVLAQQALIDAQQETETLARYTYQAVTKRVDAGASPVFEQQRAEAALARARLDVVTAQQTKQAMIKSLAIMWGEKDPTFTGVKGDLFTLQSSPSLTALFNTLLNSPNLEVYTKESRLQASQVRLTQAANQSDLSWTGGIRRINGIDDTAFVAGVSMPLFAGNRNIGEYEKQRAVQGQLEQQKQTATQNLYHQLNMALVARNNALLNVQTLQDSIIPPLVQALELVEQAYINGRFSYFEWVSTRQELLNAKQALIQSAKQAHQRGADIESLTAQPLADANVTSSSSETK